jgi:hypothetical protein
VAVGSGVVVSDGSAVAVSVGEEGASAIGEAPGDAVAVDVGVLSLARLAVVAVMVNVVDTVPNEPVAVIGTKVPTENPPGIVKEHEAVPLARPVAWQTSVPPVEPERLK